MNGVKSIRIGKIIICAAISENHFSQGLRDMDDLGFLFKIENLVIMTNLLSAEGLRCYWRGHVAADIELF